MSKRPSRHMVQRAVAVLVALLFGVFGMDVASLVRIQLIQADEYRSKAESQQLSDTEIQPQRGLIYDRNKKVLAQSANVWLVYINPSKIPNDKVREAISEGLAEILEMDKETILKKAQKSNYGYVAVKKQIEKEMKDAVSDFISKHDDALKKIDQKNVPDDQKDAYYAEIIFIDPDVKRYYPNSHLASTVLGFTGADGVGRWGLEAKYNETLSGTPGRILTAKNAVADRVRGLKLGAYDYIVKPFAPAELLARVEGLLRHTGRRAATLRVFDAEVDPDNRTVTQNGRAVELTPREFTLLLVLVRARGQALYREILYERVWGPDAEPNPRALDLHIHRLRKKLDWADKIVTVPKVGYKLLAER